MAGIINEAILLLGGNVGDRAAFLSEAGKKIEERCGGIEKWSALYETDPWGKKDQDKFLNQVLILRTSLSPERMLEVVLGIEEELGRKRKEKYGPRIIDIDLLFFNDQVIELPGLTVPHPQLQNRRFVLVPLNEIAPEKFHPLLKKTVAQLLEECPDTLDVHKFE